MKSGGATLDNLYSALLEREHIRSKSRASFYHNFLFSGFDFNGAQVLDIGGGDGTLSFYAACRGAKKVVCLEPEAEGSTTGVRAAFEDMRSRLGLGNRVTLEPAPLQAYEPHGATFDLIVSHNSVNHLDEEACIQLLERESARDTYRALFSGLASLSKRGARLVLCDCSRHNFFARLGVRNPFAPTIEWHKHQTPEVWASLLREVGFRSFRVRWTPINRFRSYGRLLTGHRLVSYFLVSHFCLTATMG